MIWPCISFQVIFYVTFLFYYIINKYLIISSYLILFSVLHFNVYFHMYVSLQKHNLRYNYLLYYLLITPFYDALNHLVFYYFVHCYIEMIFIFT